VREEEEKTTFTKEKIIRKIILQLNIRNIFEIKDVA